MSGPVAELRPFVSALDVDGEGHLRLDGRKVRRPPNAGNHSPPLLVDLTLCLYENAYARRFGAAEVLTPGEAPADLAAGIAAANDTKPRREEGWRATSLGADGWVAAERHGRHRRFAPGRYLVVDGAAPPRPGAELSVDFPAGSATLQPGFYYCFGTARRDPDDQTGLIRFYLNTRPSAAAEVAGALTRVLNRYEIPFDLKVMTGAAEFARRDSAVLYVTQDLFDVTALAIASVLPALAAGLNDDVPLFTKRMAPGIAVAEDPRLPGESFGSARCRMAAEAALAARQGARFCPERFEALFAERAAERGLALDTLWRNAGSQATFELPVLPARAS